MPPLDDSDSEANHHHEVFTTKKSDPVFTEDLIVEIGALFIDE